MAWVRFQLPGGRAEGKWGILEGDRIRAVSSSQGPEGNFIEAPERIPLPGGGSLEEGRGPTDAPRFSAADVRLLSPLEHPASFRDFYCFEEHVRRARSMRGLEMPEEWYRHPTFYFSNPHCIYGPEESVPHPQLSRELDFELEVGCVIGRPGRNLQVGNAGAYIAGYTLLNDWSARDVQREEMTVGLGPAKGKDFATSLGPYLVPPEEIESLRSGRGYDIELTVHRNGRLLARGNWKSIHYSFEEMIAYASRDAWLVPGDLIGSGTVGGGSILEIGAEAAGGWLGAGDAIELAGGPLGRLRNTIVSQEQGREEAIGGQSRGHQ